MNILVTGSEGQIGSELVPALRKKYGKDNVIGLDIQNPKGEGPYEKADVCNKELLKSIIQKYEIDVIYHLVGILSANGEKDPSFAWTINVGGLKNILDLAVELKIKKVFWPSSIAAFGPSAPKDNTPQNTFLDPFTMYGVSKVSGELLCNYYFVRYGLDVRSLRYPGIISYKTPPGGGTTDYAIAIFYGAIQEGRYECFLKEDATLPMMYMPDAIKATIDIMDAPAEQIKVRTSYNLAAVSFSPKELADQIRKKKPLEMTYSPDIRQKIAESWPRVIDDSSARSDWGWKHDYGMEEMTEDMLEKLSEKLTGKSFK